MIEVAAVSENLPTRGAFSIARGVKHSVDVVVVRARAGEREGWGEGTPVYYRDQTAAGALDMLGSLADIAVDRSILNQILPPGAARNALDCALWDLEAKDAGVPVWALAGIERPRAVVTALTLSLDTPGAMERAARRAANRPLLKIKLGGDGGDRERVAAVRLGAPSARLIVDANEAWEALDIEAEAAAMATIGVELIEQPVRAGHEDVLDGVRSSIPLAADESCHTRADLDRLMGRFQVVNIKLDKAGGLTEALALAAEARARGLEAMVGCMLCTSLAIAPAMLVAQGARWVDLDGPLLLERDREGGLRFDAYGRVWPDEGSLWG